MRSCGEGFRKSGEPKIRRSEDAKLRRGFHKIWKGGDKYNSLFKEICYTKMPTKYLPIQCHEDPKIRRSEDARPEQCPPSATVLNCLTWWKCDICVSVDSVDLVLLFFMSPSDGVHWEYRNFTKLGPPRLYNVAVCMPRKWDCTKKKTSGFLQKYLEVEIDLEI